MTVDESASATLAVFPLTGTLLLPGTFLPLNIFEQRYRNLVADALAGEKRLGMIQPRLPLPDNFGEVAGGQERPDLYAVGCCGTIVEWQQERDGRFVILLEGRRRFEVLDELQLHRGYRRVRARLYEDERAASGAESPLRPAVLGAALEACRQWEIAIDPDVLAALPGWRLVNVLSAALPFHPAEKQLLLEAENPDERAETLLRLLSLEPNTISVAPDFAPPN